MLDTKRLIAEVVARNGIRIDPDDPAFALVTLVQLVLEESSRQISVAGTPVRQARRRAVSYRSIAIVAVAAIAVFMVGVWIGIHWNR